MSAYKVWFNKGIVVSAELINADNIIPIVKFEDSSDHYVEWYVVDAESKEEAIIVADEVVNTIWGIYRK